MSTTYIQSTILDRVGMQTWRQSQAQCPWNQKCIGSHILLGGSAQKSMLKRKWLRKSPTGNHHPVNLAQLITWTAQGLSTFSWLKHQKKHWHLVTNSMTLPATPTPGKPYPFCVPTLPVTTMANPVTFLYISVSTTRLETLQSQVLCGDFTAPTPDTW